MIQWHWPADPSQSWEGDRGLAYGDGVFETLRVTSAGPVLAEGHRERLLAGCRFLRLAFSGQDWQRWWDEASRRGWLRADDSAGHVVKLIVTRGSGGRGYQLSAAAVPRVITSCAPMPSVPEESVVLYRCHTPVTPCQSGEGLKTLNRLDQVLAAAELPAGAFDGLMSDREGRPVESTRSNLFLLDDDTLYTPPVWQLAVAGVMRKALIACAGELGLNVVEQPLSWDLLQDSQGAFLTSSVSGVVPVARIDGLHLHYPEKMAAIRALVRQRFGI